MSLRAAINAKCKECIYDSHARGAWRQQVEACTSYRCPLYPVRPKSTASGAEAEDSGELPESRTIPAESEAA